MKKQKEGSLHDKRPPVLQDLICYIKEFGRYESRVWTFFSLS